MAAVPTSYQFIKAVNNNVVIIGLDGITPVVQYSLQPGKDLKIDERNPDNVLIPVEESKGAQNKFLSISYKKMDFANSTPSATNPADITEALDFLSSDFFFELGGGGGSVLARNGVVLSGSYVELGGDLVRITTIDTDGYDFSILNGDFSFHIGEVDLVTGFPVPFAGVYRIPDINGLSGYVSYVDATAFGSGETLAIGWGNAAAFIFNGLNSNKTFQEYTQATTNSVWTYGVFLYDESFGGDGFGSIVAYNLDDDFDVTKIKWDNNGIELEHNYGVSYADKNLIKLNANGAEFDVNKILMPEVAPLDFADDTAAAAGGVDLNQVYHNNGALRIRLV